MSLAILMLMVFGSAWGAPPVSEQTACPSRLSAHIKPRPANAMTGSEFAARTVGFSRQQRGAMVLAELLAGNVPDFLRRLKPVRLQRRLRDGRQHAAIICVMPDYLAIGSNADYLRIPMNFYYATAVARRFGFILPTRRIVNAIDRQATVRLRPEPMAPGPQMHSMAYYRKHNHKIRTQRLALGYPLGALVAGHKKDVVLTNRLLENSDRIAIYGWHRLNHEPIQPLSTVHGARYEDYSHGIRLVSDVVQVDRARWSIYDVLQHPMLSLLLSREGTIRHLRQLMGFAREASCSSGSQDGSFDGCPSPSPDRHARRALASGTNLHGHDRYQK